MHKISQKIIDYAIWYYLKYYPSPKKLFFKLKQKFGPKSENGEKYGGINDEEIDFIILEKLKNIIQEEEVIQSKMKSYINKGKSKLYVKQKMFERMEDKDLVEKYLSEFFLKGELENIEKELKKMGFSNELEYNLKQKLLKKLLTKGFRYDEVRIVMNQ